MNQASRLFWLVPVLPAAGRRSLACFPVPQVIAGSWARGAARFEDYPGFAEVFMPDGDIPGEGDIFANPALARTLEMMAAGGRHPGSYLEK